MKQTIEAIYENGVLKPVKPLRLPNGAHVTLDLDDETEAARQNADELRKRYPNSFGIMPHEDAEEIRRIIAEEFGQINLDEWK
jgi:predicted DNA-binding antitoxin AbrB/MazE fold protein